MAVPKEKVIAVLTAKLAGKNVSQKLKDSYATRWADKIATEDDIDTYVDDRFEDVADAQKEADRRATEASTKARADAAKAAAGDDGKGDDGKTDPPAELPADAPAWLKPFMEAQKQQMEALTQTVTGMQQAKTAETAATRYYADPRLAGFPKNLLKFMEPKDEAGLEAAITAAETELKPFADKLHAAGFGLDQPAGGKPAGGGGAAKVDADVVAFAERKNAAVTQTSK